MIVLKGQIAVEYMLVSWVYGAMLEQVDRTWRSQLGAFLFRSAGD